jgi:hypothetical protein
VGLGEGGLWRGSLTAHALTFPRRRRCNGSRRGVGRAGRGGHHGLSVGEGHIARGVPTVSEHGRAEARLFRQLIAVEAVVGGVVGASQRPAAVVALEAVPRARPLGGLDRRCGGAPGQTS